MVTFGDLYETWRDFTRHWEVEVVTVSIRGGLRAGRRAGVAAVPARGLHRHLHVLPPLQVLTHQRLRVDLHVAAFAS